MRFYKSFSQTERFLTQLLAMKSASQRDACLFWSSIKLNDRRRYLVFHKTEIRCTVPGGAAIPGRCVE